MASDEHNTSAAAWPKSQRDFSFAKLELFVWVIIYVLNILLLLLINA